MPRQRLLEPGFFSDDLICDFPIEVAYMYMGTWVFADDYGNIIASPAQWRLWIFPCRGLETKQIKQWQEVLEEKGRIIPYQVGGKDYFHIPTLARRLEKLNKRYSAYPPYENAAYYVTPCSQCGKTRKDELDLEFEWHHIDHNPKNNMPSNLTFLCRPCHRKYHGDDKRRLSDAQSELSDAQAEEVQQENRGKRIEVRGKNNTKGVPPHSLEGWIERVKTASKPVSELGEMILLLSEGKEKFDYGRLGAIAKKHSPAYIAKLIWNCASARPADWLDYIQGILRHEKKEEPMGELKEY